MVGEIADLKLNPGVESEEPTANTPLKTIHGTKSRSSTHQKTIL